MFVQVNVFSREGRFEFLGEDDKGEEMLKRKWKGGKGNGVFDAHRVGVGWRAAV